MDQAETNLTLRCSNLYIMQTYVNREKMTEYIIIYGYRKYKSRRFSQVSCQSGVKFFYSVYFYKWHNKCHISYISMNVRLLINILHLLYYTLYTSTAIKFIIKYYLFYIRSIKIHKKTKLLIIKLCMIFLYTLMYLT